MLKTVDLIRERINRAGTVEEVNVCNYVISIVYAWLTDK